MFKWYWKIYSLLNSEWEREETSWILNWVCYIQEKIDWANLSVWQEDWNMFVWSRTQVVWTNEIKNWFRWAVEYINNHEWIKKLFNTLERENNTKDIRLYWEWLVAHTITNYNPEAYNNFYLYDIEINWERIDIQEVNNLSLSHQIKCPKLWGTLENPTKEELLFYVGKSDVWPIWEWIVIKNPNFINQYGNRVYAKIVWEKFKEENSVVFGNHQRWDNEMKIVNKYCTLWRVKKIINKLENIFDRWVIKQDTNAIIWMIQNDIITEEAWAISKEWTIDFKRLKWLISKRRARIFIDFIDWNEESVAFN